MKENVISFFIIIGVLALVGALWLAYENPALNPRLQDQTYKIIRKWDMPVELEEISGINYIQDGRMACVQDEEGSIFIFDLNTDLVEKKINFGKSGDYEAIALVDSTAYVLESSGKLHVIKNYLYPTIEIESIQTPFSGKNNMESMTADSINNRLLLTVKDRDPNSKSFKGIYALDLETRQVSLDPIFKIPLNDPIFKSKSDKDDESNNYYPSEIAVNPIDGNIYVLEGKNPQLLIMDKNGKLLQLHTLNKEFFPQPEGMTFSPEGILFISNEGKDGKANILEVELKKPKP